jgi:arylsulfatase A-like enzyme
MYREREMPAVPIGDWGDVFGKESAPRRPDGMVGRIDARVLQRARAGYYGHMSHIDHQINRFIETLAEFGQRDNTWICFVSDHGEMMGDHDLFRKGYPYEGSARVPLILSGPPEAKLNKGATCDPVVELRDIMPTLLECAGLDVPETIEGKSLLALARGQASAVREYLHGEHTLFGQSMHWITDLRYKYIWFSQTGHEQLFDMANDPQELHDIARRPSSSAAIDRLRRLLISELAGREENFTDGQTLTPGRPVRPVLSHLT